MLLCTEQLFPTFYHTELEWHSESLKISHSLLASHIDLERANVANGDYVEE